MKELKELHKLIDECCDDIFYRREPLANVKARLYHTIKEKFTFNTKEK
jgi:hypothetical protein